MNENQEFYVEVPRPPRRSHAFRKMGRRFLLAIAFLTPFFFLPITIDPVGINKFVLVSLLSLGGLICLLGAVFEEKKFEYPRSWFFLVLILFTAAEVLSAVFSIAPATSWYGSLRAPDSILAI